MNKFSSILYRASLLMLLQSVNIPAAYEESIAFVRPLASMERDDIAQYFARVFNREGYGPFSLNHLRQFLQFGNTLSHNQLKFTASMIDLFLARLKEALYINPFVMHDFIKTVIEHVAPSLTAACQMQVSSIADGMREQLGGHAAALKQRLTYELKNGFYVLKFDPELFLTRLTDAIIRDLPVEDLAHYAVDAMLHSEALHVRSSLVRIIEAGLDRLVWSPAEEGFAWQNVKDIANHLFMLYRCNVIPDEQTLNQLYWTLTYRFIYCLGLIGEHISLTTYEIMKQDILEGSNILLTFSIGEQDVMRPRSRWLADAVLAASVRSQMTADGAWVAPLKSEYQCDADDVVAVR